MDPASAIANSVGKLFDFGSKLTEVIGFGKRAEYAQQPGWIRVSDYQKKDYTAAIVLIAGTLILIMILLVILKKK